MSDTALFQNADEQEAVYAPQQLPEGSAAKEEADVEARDADNTTPGFIAVPAGNAVSSGGASGTSGTASAAVPAVGAAALSHETQDEDTERRAE